MPSGCDGKRRASALSCGVRRVVGDGIASVCVGDVSRLYALRKRPGADAADTTVAAGGANPAPAAPGGSTALPTIQVTAPHAKPRATRAKPAQVAAPSAAPTRAGIALPDRRAQYCRRRSSGAAIGEPDDLFRRRSQRPSGRAAGRDSRSGSRPGGGRSRRRRQGQSVLLARLQSRSRHRHGHLCRRRADQSAEPCARPGLHRPQLAHSGNGQRAGSPQGTVFRRRRRLCQRRRLARVATRQCPAEHRVR